MSASWHVIQELQRLFPNSEIHKTWKSWPTNVGSQMSQWQVTHQGGSGDREMVVVETDPYSREIFAVFRQGRL